MLDLEAMPTFTTVSLLGHIYLTAVLFIMQSLGNGLCWHPTMAALGGSRVIVANVAHLLRWLSRDVVAALQLCSRLGQQVCHCALAAFKSWKVAAPCYVSWWLLLCVLLRLVVLSNHGFCIACVLKTLEPHHQVWPWLSTDFWQTLSGTYHF